MDEFRGVGWLGWWADSSTYLPAVEVALAIDSTETGWDGSGMVAKDADRDWLWFLWDLDPVFALQLGDEATHDVVVTLIGDGGDFTLRPID